LRCRGRLIWQFCVRAICEWIGKCGANDQTMLDLQQADANPEHGHNRRSDKLVSGQPAGPSRIQKVTAHVLTRNGTNVPGKAPQGQPEAEEQSAPAGAPAGQVTPGQVVPAAPAGQSSPAAPAGQVFPAAPSGQASPAAPTGQASPATPVGRESTAIPAGHVPAVAKSDGTTPVAGGPPSTGAPR
jgi:hypothetical protein